MNESASEDSSEFSSEDPQLTDTDALDGTNDADDTASFRSAREGLPPSFRMRHDAHYVDELMARSTAASQNHDARARRTEERKAYAPSRPAAAQREGAAPAALALLASRLESLVAHAAVIRPHAAAAPFIADAVHAELARVTRLARASALVHDTESPVLRSVSMRSLADALASASAPIARLGGMDCAVTADDGGLTVLADAPLLVQALAGTVDALVELASVDPRRRLAFDGRDAAPRLSIALQSVEVRPAVIIDVVCPTLSLSEARAQRLFDNRADDYAAAPAAGILLASAAHVVRAHRGRADVKRHNGVGVTISYTLPQTVCDTAVSTSF